MPSLLGVLSVQDTTSLHLRSVPASFLPFWAQLLIMSVSFPVTYFVNFKNNQEVESQASSHLQGLVYHQGLQGII